MNDTQGDHVHAPRLAGTVRLKTDRVGTRPWIYRKMVERPDGIADGDLVAVVDTRGRPVGKGFYNSRSKIGLRLLSRRAADEGGFIRRAIKDAVYLRHRTLGLDRLTEAYRVINSEGDGLSGLIVDRYGDHLAVEIFSLGFWRLRGWLAGVLSGLFAGARVVVRADRAVQANEGFRVPDVTEQVETVIRENGMAFHVDLGRGHKTGFFCDQRDNRLTLARHVRDANVCDLCCYTGGFSLYARRLGAAGRVVAVDLDEEALTVARRNAALNACDVEWVHADAFEYLRSEAARKTRWDVMILDPPKFVSSRAQRARGEAKYKDLNAAAMALLKQNGLLLTCSCSGLVSERDFIFLLRKAAARVDRDLQILNVSGPAADHPFVPEFEEGRYLKAVFCTLRDRR